ncbi:MAG: hypothetical protein GQ540_03170 [Lutibacter sp.]|uniref:hypothetical protein n=1 Tax=Lutibacter sp. TaxID=1925666 RepID=UPI0019EC3AC0|nr:hypothetical protein [Lutibacter sp.]NOR27512.1 hypothetical protein [Lutibacter sp.]
MKCNKCTYNSLKQMIMGGKPFQYSGDIPCQRCKHLLIENDEFVPASLEIDKNLWGTFEKHYRVKE